MIKIDVTQYNSLEHALKILKKKVSHDQGVGVRNNI